MAACPILSSTHTHTHTLSLSLSLVSVWVQNVTRMRLGDVVDTLKDIYCKHVGFEFMFIQERDRVMWLQDRIQHSGTRFDSEKRKKILTDVIHAAVSTPSLSTHRERQIETSTNTLSLILPSLSPTHTHLLPDAVQGFEEFLKKKYVSEKRFGLEGCESLIAGMKSMLEVGHGLGVEVNSHAYTCSGESERQGEKDGKCF